MRAIQSSILVIFTITFLFIAQAADHAMIAGADAKNILEIRAHVIYRDSKIEGAVIKLFQENLVVKKYVTKSNGKFKFLLFGESEYMIEVSKDKFVTERISINTKVDGPIFANPMFQFSIDLMKASKFEGIDLSRMDFPTALIKYDRKLEDYSYDKAYAKYVKGEINQLKQEAYKLKYPDR